MLPKRDGGTVRKRNLDAIRLQLIAPKPMAKSQELEQLAHQLTTKLATDD
jgi:hypothetical protein